MKYSNDHDVEQLLIQAAGRLPAPQKPVPVSPCMKQRAKQGFAGHLPGFLRQKPAARAAAVILMLLCLGTTTALAASPALREAVIRFFTSGAVEQPPIGLLNPDGEEASAADTSDRTAAAETAADETSPKETTAEQTAAERETGSSPSGERVQTAGSLTLVETPPLDSHFSALYVSSSDYLELIYTPSGTPLFCTRQGDAAPVYYALEGGTLREIVLAQQTLTASVQLGRLPGVMSYGGDTDFWRVELPPMEFTVSWQQYGDNILIDNSDTDYRFDIGSTFGGLEGDYDGRFYSRAIPGRSDVVQVFFNFDGQQTQYEYPFLLYLEDGRVDDPLADIDLSGWPCITELAISDDLLHATAQAGSSHDRLHPVSIDLRTGTVSEALPLTPPETDCFIWFPTGEHTLFYGVGSDAALDGYLYDAQSERSVLLFSGAASHTYEDGFARCYYDFIGGGFAIYYEEETVSLLNLRDGSFTLLEGVPASRNVDYFFNPDYTVLSIRFLREDGNTGRLGFIVPGTPDAAYFDRELPEGIHEESAGWYGPGGFMIRAADEARERYYLYLYEYKK